MAGPGRGTLRRECPDVQGVTVNRAHVPTHIGRDPQRIILMHNAQADDVGPAVYLAKDTVTHYLADQPLLRRIGSE